MTPAQQEALMAFLAARRGKLGWIAKKTKYEYELGDLEGEAWLIAADMVGQDPSLDLADAGVQDRLLARLYQRTVKFCEIQVRYAERIDRAFEGDDGASEHPLMRRLQADGGAHPLSLLLEGPPVHLVRDDPDPYASKAAAYIRLIQRCGHRMPAVARFLRISVSHWYRCCKRAKQVAKQQPSLPGMILPEDDERALVPWRAVRAERRARQLELFPVLPQLWGACGKAE